MLEFYIEDRLVELDKELSINFTYETIDPTKLSSIKNSFSKTLNIPGTPHNNDLFGWLCRSEKEIVEDSTTETSNVGTYFNPHKKSNWKIFKNGELIQQGYLVLNNILRQDNQITYQVTLFGGLGEFFYNLSYNEDGTKKTLADLNWGFYKLNSQGNPINFNEDTDTFFDVNALTVARNWRKNQIVPNTTFTDNDVERNITFVPEYTGNYEDFDSKKMLVNVNNGKTTSPSPTYWMDSSTRARFLQSFPDTQTEGTDTYQALSSGLLPSNPNGVFGLVNFSRDLDPWEASCLNPLEIPLAIRFQKLLQVISKPENNGGYTVEWPEYFFGPREESNYINYTWLLLGKMKKELGSPSINKITETSELDDFNFELVYHSRRHRLLDEYSNINFGNPKVVYINGQTDVTLSVPGNYRLTTHNNTLLRVYINELCGGHTKIYNNKYITGAFRHYFTNNIKKGIQSWYFQVVHTFVRAGASHRVIKNKIDIYYYRTKNKTDFDDKYNFGSPVQNAYGYENVQENIINAVITKINSAKNLNITRNDVEVHNVQISTSGYTRSLEYGRWPSNNYYSTNRYNIKFKTSNETSSIDFTTTNNNTLIDVYQDQWTMWALWQYDNITSLYNAGILGSDLMADSFIVASFSGNNVDNIFSYVENRDVSTPTYTIRAQDSIGQNYPYPLTRIYTGVHFDYSAQNRIFFADTSGFNTVSLTKQLLFAETESPAKYLIDYCKLLNLKFVVDNKHKKISIIPFSKYYKRDEIVDLDYRVDYSRNINMKRVLSNYKTLKIGLNTEETYPVYLFNKINQQKFNELLYELPDEFNIIQQNLFDNIYTNQLDYQQNSVFYKENPQLPKAYNTPTVSWTLFKQNGNDILQKEYITSGSNINTTTVYDTLDPLPKLADFDKNNKYTNIKNSLVYLNGWVVNYEYIQRTDYQQYVYSPKILIVDDTTEQYYLAGGRCYEWSFQYTDTKYNYGVSNGQYYAAPFVIPFFSKDLWNTTTRTVWEWSSKVLASWNIIKQDNLNQDVTNMTFSQNPDSTSALELRMSITDYENYKDTHHYTSSRYPDELENTRVYDRCWKNYLNEIFDPNAVEIEFYADLTGLGDNNDVFRKFYKYNGNLYIIRKLENFKVAENFEDRFSKVTLLKINNIDNWAE